VKTCSPWEGVTLEKFIENCGRDPMQDQGQSARSPPPEEERVTETACDELTATPIPSAPVLLGGRS